MDRSHPKDRSVVWLYPDKSGDESSAFLLADGECKRIETQALDKTSKVYLMQWWCSGRRWDQLGTNWDHLEAIRNHWKSIEKSHVGIGDSPAWFIAYGVNPVCTPYVIFWSFPGVLFLESRPSWLKIIVPRKKQQIVPECSNIPMVYSHFGPRKMTKFPLFLPWNLDENSEASCVAVYRVPSPSAGTILLNHFHQPGTISHAVLGGHGSDNAWRLGEFTTNFWGSWSQSVHRKPKGRGMFYFLKIGFTMVYQISMILWDDILRNEIGWYGIVGSGMLMDWWMQHAACSGWTSDGKSTWLWGFPTACLVGICGYWNGRAAIRMFLVPKLLEGKIGSMGIPGS